MPVTNPPKDNITMIAFHGKKDRYSDLMRLLDATKEKIRETLKDLNMPADLFIPYTNNQTHATIIGMEVIRIDGELYSANFLNNDGRFRTIEPQRLLTLMDAIQRTKDQESYLTIRFGGFGKAYCNCKGFDLLNWECPTGDSEFHAFNRSAYEGSFYGFSGGPVMLTGWPIDSVEKKSAFNRNLFGLRRAAGELGFLDKYHMQEKPHWKDDDFFIRIGSFDRVEESLKPKFQCLLDRLREFLWLQGPTTIEVDVDATSIVYYDNPSLDRLKNDDPNNAISLAKAINNPSLVDDLYARWAMDH